MTPMKLGTAQWEDQTALEKKHRFKAGSIWLGRSINDVPIGYNDDRHVALSVGTRGGKGTDCIVPALLTWPGSICVVDPKGENASVTSARRGQGSGHAFFHLGQAVHVLDPFRAATVDESVRSRFNPLGALNPKADETIDDAAMIADALVIINEDSKDPFWERAARDMVKVLILHIVTDPAFKGRRNLVTLRQLLTRGDWDTVAVLRNAGDKDIPTAQGLLWSEIARNPSFGGIIAGGGETFFGMWSNSLKIFESVLQVALQNTEFIDSPAMQRVLERSDFKLADLKTRPEGVSLYLCLPQRFMPSHFRWLRMMISLVINQMEKTRKPALTPEQREQIANGGPVPPLSVPLLMVLDEFAALERMKVIENAVAQIAGYGVKMYFVLQSLEQLKAVYKDKWETFLANSGTKIFFNVEDHFSREYISKLIGETEVVREAANRSEASGATETATRGHSTSRTASRSQADGTTESRSHTETRGVNSSTTQSRSDGFTSSTGRTGSAGINGSTGHTQSTGTSSSASETQSEGSNQSTSRGHSSGTNKSWSTTHSTGTSHSSGDSRGLSISTTCKDPDFGGFFAVRRGGVHTMGMSSSYTNTTGESQTTSMGQTDGTSSTLSHSQTEGRSAGRSASRTEGTSSGSSSSETEGFSRGYSVSDTKGTSQSHSHSTNQGTSAGSSDAVTQGTSSTRTAGNSVTEALNENNASGRTHTNTAGTAETIHRRPLIQPDEIGGLFANIEDREIRAYPGLALTLVAGKRPAVVRRTRYYEDIQFRFTFDPHPDHPETPVQTYWAYFRAEMEAAEEERRRKERERWQKEHEERQAKEEAERVRAQKIAAEARKALNAATGPKSYPKLYQAGKITRTVPQAQRRAPYPPKPTRKFKWAYWMKYTWMERVLRKLGLW